MRYLSAALIATVSAVALTQIASAADLPRKAPAYAPPPAPVYSWTGFYVGVNAGWVRSDNSMNNVATPIPSDVLGVVAGVSEGLAALSTGALPVGDKSGFIGGGQIGYNVQFNWWVAGIEADIQGISGSGSTGSITTPPGGIVVVGVPVTSTLTGTMDTKWLGTVRGRLGFLPTPTLLVYGTGGLAYGHVNASISLSQSAPNGFSGSGAGAFSETRTGWAAGGGVEWMFAQNWSAKLEYLHYDLGTGSFTWAALGTPTSTFFSGVVYQTEVTSVDLQGNIFRAGLNYKF